MGIGAFGAAAGSGLALAAAALLAARPAPAGLPEPVAKDVPYGKYADPVDPHSAERLDVYAHSTAAAPQPVLLEVHGGGWSQGKKGEFANYLEGGSGVGVVPKAFAAGFAIVTVDYPLTAPAQLPDGSKNPKFPRNTAGKASRSVQRAIQFVRANAAQWNLDPTRVYAIGGSAGGTLALAAAMERDLAKPKSKNPLWAASSRPDGVVFCWAPTALDAAHFASVGARPAQWDYFGAKDGKAFAKVPKAKTRAASPAWRATHEGGGPKESADAALRNASLPLLGVYAALDPAMTSADFALPTLDPHDAVFGLLLREAFAGFASNPKNPKVDWLDLTLLSYDPEQPESQLPAADAVVAWLAQRAGLAN